MVMTRNLEIHLLTHPLISSHLQNKQTKIFFSTTFLYSHGFSSHCGQTSLRKDLCVLIDHSVLHLLHLGSVHHNYHHGNGSLQDLRLAKSFGCISGPSSTGLQASLSTLDHFLQKFFTSFGFRDTTVSALVQKCNRKLEPNRLKPQKLLWLHNWKSRGRTGIRVGSSFLSLGHSWFSFLPLVGFFLRLSGRDGLGLTVTQDAI